MVGAFTARVGRTFFEVEAACSRMRMMTCQGRARRRGAEEVALRRLHGVAAGLAATDPKLVPYGAMTATFYTGVGCLIVPSVLFFIVTSVF